MDPIFSTKADVLRRLKGILRTAHIPPLVIFSITEWLQNRQKCLNQVKIQFGEIQLIVRSSCQLEDNTSASNAGAYLSLLNIGLPDLEDAVDQVIASYGRIVDSDEVLIQPMLKNVVRSGVAFSHDPNTCAPYRIVNWSEGESTTLITGGQDGYTWQSAASSRLPPPIELTGVIALIEELLALFNDIPIDCEFAVTNENGIELLWLLQVRPLILPSASESAHEQAERLKLIAEKVERGMHPHPFLMGQRTVYGVMPDWNPAEIIGIRPKPLALSLYRELITDAIWAYQRHNYGYHNLRSFPLLQDISGLPYIDVRVSFNSFVPAGTSPELANRLVNYYIDRLIEQPNFHDKVEFEIIFSCYTIDLPKRLEKLRNYGFSEQDCRNLAHDLRSLTNNIINCQTGLWQKDREKVETLEHRRNSILDSNLDSISKIYWLIEDCKRYGTLPFAGLARAGFIAVQFLRSLVDEGILQQSDYDHFMESLNTVSSQMSHDFAELSREAFLRKYGHLRPGTYDILSPRYDETPDRYFDWHADRTTSHQRRTPFSLTLEQFHAIENLLKEHELEHDVLRLFDFIKGAIEGREYAKFVFTKSVSDVLSMLTRLGKEFDLTTDELSYLNIHAIHELYGSCDDPRRAFYASIAEGKKSNATTKRLALPPLITHPDDVWSFRIPTQQANYITQKRVSGHVAFANSPHKNLPGSILLIPSADPGFDWVFSHHIAGFITMYGGVNSHMAIRAGELGLPAIIGIGETAFNRLASRQSIEIDAASKQVRGLK